MRKLTRQEIKIASQYGEIGRCAICNHIGLKSCCFAIKDPKLNGMFALGGTHVMVGIATYYSDGTDALTPNGYVERPSVCNTCHRNHFDQRSDDGNGNNPRGRPLTEKAKSVATVDRNEWLKLCAEAEQRHKDWLERNKNEEGASGKALARALMESLRPR